ncbi:hypothetical protein ABH931_000319 [Streptacidiphilus sp. MAP12-33]|uniref:luciferase domain-containing protein n=1 Tax=Streptacidiphilus sp. MAP12-33 TaxID=3156266 RepID=UPI0035198764
MTTHHDGGQLMPPRRGRPPLVSVKERAEQLTQAPSPELQQRLLDQAAALRGVRIGPSYVCVPGSRAYHLSPTLAHGPVQAFFAGTEFGHLHPPYDGSLHLMLPPETAEQVCEAGWGVSCAPAGSVLVFGPRDEDELHTVWLLLQTAHRRATGTS